MSWEFEQSSGRIYDTSHELQGIGYAGGDCGLHPEGVNSPNLENEKDIGPIPAGDYTADYIVMQHPKLGHFAIHLAPDPATSARIAGYGRDPESFFWHGDRIDLPGKQAASDGCIAGSLDVRQDFWMGLDHDLQVVRGPSSQAPDVNGQVSGL